MSLPLPPLSTLSAPLPVMVLSRLLPVPLIAGFPGLPVRVRFSTLVVEASEKLILPSTLSLSAPPSMMASSPLLAFIKNVSLPPWPYS
ncbi:MAG TPA: hypothetical protein DEP36_03315, partial [Gammaproteobacteria bacterium]|nr:hypothetical protein [Gammaproteobacteria bacterium]